MTRVLSREEMKAKYSFVTSDDFARDHGFEDYYVDMIGSNRPLFSIPKLDGGSKYAYTIYLPNGKWMALVTDVMPIDYDVAYCDTRDEALRHLYERWLWELREGRVQPWSWYGPDPETFGAPVRVYPLSYYEQEGGVYDDSGNGGGPVDPDSFVYAVRADDIDDIVGVLGGSRRDYWCDSVTGFWLRYRD